MSDSANHRTERTLGLLLLGGMALVFAVIASAFVQASLVAKTGNASAPDMLASAQSASAPVANLEPYSGQLPRWQAHARPFSATESDPLIAIIAIDPGERREALDAMLDRNRNITLAVGHDFKRARWRVNTLREKGHEVLTLLPTAYDAEDLSRHANVLRRGLGKPELRRRTLWHLSALSGTVGALEYGGGDILADQSAMQVVFKAFATDHGLFIDSAANTDSIALPIARTKGVPVTRAKIRISGDADADLIKSRLDEAVTHAQRWGYATIIVEPGPSALQHVGNWVSEPTGGVRIAPVSAIVGRTRTMKPSS